MKLLLTGATGFVGRNLLLRILREQRYEEIFAPVRSLEKLAGQFAADGFSGIPATVKPILTEAPRWDFSDLPSVEHVVHSAGLLSGNSLEDYFQTNTEGTRSLFRQLQERARVVVLSSLAAAGPCGNDEQCKLERGDPRPVTWYGQSKLAMEEMLGREFAERDYVCLRPPMVLGPRDSATLPLFKMARGPVRFKPGFRLKQYSFIAVNDLVSAILAALDKRSAEKLYYVASDETISDRDLIEYAAQAMAKKGLLLPIPQPLIWSISRMVDAVPAWRRAIPNLTADRAREIWPDRWVVSADRFKADFGWRPSQDLRTVLRETGEWYQRTGQLPS